MKPIGSTNLFTGRIEKKRVHLKDGIEFRVVYENKYGELFVKDKGNWVQVIKRGKWGEYYIADNSKRKYRVQFQKIDYCSIVVEAQSEDDAWDMVQDSLYADTLEGYVEDSYETKVTDVEELKDEDV